MKKICALFLVFSFFATCAFADGDGGNIGGNTKTAYIQNSPIMSKIRAESNGGQDPYAYLQMYRDPKVREQKIKEQLLSAELEANRKADEKVKNAKAEQTRLILTDAATKEYRWSFSALSYVYKKMIKDCHTVGPDELHYITNWIREKGNTFSILDLINVCGKAGFQKIDRKYSKDGKTYDCKIPYQECHDDGSGCGEDNWIGTPNLTDSACNVFISTLISKNSEYETNKINDFGKVGTYIKKVRNGVYQIVDVILPKDYWVNNSINRKANSDQDNTKVYEVDSDMNEIYDTGWHTWTADMFFNVSNNKAGFRDVLKGNAKETGNVVGATTNSFFFSEEDVTNSIYRMASDVRNLAPISSDDKSGVVNQVLHFPQAVISGIKSRPGGEYDIKEYYPLLWSRYNIKDSEQGFVSGNGVLVQDKNEAHTNAVIFDGKIATLEWIGNVLYALNGRYTTYTKATAEAAAQALSIAQGNTYESDKIQNAWEIGYELYTKRHLNRDTTFSKRFAANKKAAYRLSARQMREMYGAGEDEQIICSGECDSKPGTKDMVTCCLSSRDFCVDFEWDDICDNGGESL